MDSSKRFDQLESLLVDLARKVDQHSGILEQHTQALAELGQSMTRQEKLLTIVSEQADGITDFLKLSVARHVEAEQRQDAMMAEIQRLGKRTDASVEAIRVLLKRQENTDARLDGVVQTQLQMLQLMRADADKVDDLARRLPAVEGQEPRIQRLEDEMFRAAS